MEGRAKTERKVSTGWGRRLKHWIWWRPGRRARARGTLEGRANIGYVRGHNKGRERAGLDGMHDRGRDIR